MAGQYSPYPLPQWDPLVFMQNVYEPVFGPPVALKRPAYWENQLESRAPKRRYFRSRPKLPNNASNWDPRKLLQRMRCQTVYTEANDDEDQDQSVFKHKCILEVFPSRYGRGGVFVGQGPSEKAAHWHAAAQACRKFYRVQDICEVVPWNASEWEPMKLLRHMRQTFEVTDQGTVGTKTPHVYSCRLDVGDDKVFIGNASSIKKARMKAASLACDDLFGVKCEPPPKPVSKVAKPTPTLPSNASEWNPRELLVRMHPTAVYTNISDVNELNDPWFRYNVTIGDKVYSGAGRSKKRACQIAATRACESLFDLKIVDPYLPSNVSTWDPRELICYVYPSAVFMDVSTDNDKSVPWFRFNLIIDGKVYSGEARTRITARHNAVVQACADLFGLGFNVPKNK